MKKVLVIAYDFPPLISIGAQRPSSWYKYFPQFGYAVTVVTRQWDKEVNLPEDHVKPTGAEVIVERDEDKLREVIRVPFAPNSRDKLLLKYGYGRFILLRKLLTFFYVFAEHLSFLFDSKAAIYREAEKYLADHKVDYIIATGEPFILFKYASVLSAKYRIPWVADYRDGWTTNQGNYQQGSLQKLQTAFYRRREQKYIENVAFITTPSPGYAHALAKLHPSQKVKVVFNGYDEDAFHDMVGVTPPYDNFVISYAGIIYPHQNVEMFLDGVEKFLKDQDTDRRPLRINFYGLESQPDSKRRIMQRQSLTSLINITPRMPYAKVIKKLKASHLLLLLSGKNADWLNAKVFDYLATGNTIMLVENNHGVLQEMVSLGNGKAFNTAEEVAHFLKEEYFKSSVESKPTVGDAVKVYTRQNQAKVFCELLDTASKEKQHGGTA